MSYLGLRTDPRTYSLRTPDPLKGALRFEEAVFTAEVFKPGQSGFTASQAGCLK